VLALGTEPAIKRRKYGRAKVVRALRTLWGLLYVLSPIALADTNNAAPSGGQGDSALTFSAPPREKEADSHAIYDPIAAYLSKALGRKVVYAYPGSWGIYQGDMQAGRYDIIIDGPHFVGWRVQHIHHNVIARVPGERVYVVFVKTDSPYRRLEELGGRSLCTPAPPNLATLVVQERFPNPARLPGVRPHAGWKEDYKGLMTGKCVAAVATDKTLPKLDQAKATRVIYASPGLPDLAFTAGPRLTADEQYRLRLALLAPEASEPTARLRDKNGFGPHFEAGTNDEYAKWAVLLNNEWGWN
jgi:ABC-type phosphate/phosphonate transport system substrate-binding protein